MKKIGYILLILSIVVSCTSRTIYKKPENLIGKEEMINVWTDMYLAAGSKSAKTITLQKDINYLQLVLDKHNIDSTQFKESNLYYTSRIDDYEKMFKKVKERLEELKETYDPTTELDSILKADKELRAKQNYE